MSPAAFALLLVLLAVPLLEIALLIKVAGVIGGWPTLGIVVGTAILGLKLLRDQSFAMFDRTWRAIAAGEPQVAPVLDGMLMMLAGMLLLAPGLITDTLGLLLLIPPVRRFVAGHMVGWLVDVNAAPEPSRPRGGPRPRQSPRGGDGPTTIEGEFERLDERPIDPRESPPRDRRR